jgi:hypothetical protein
VVGEPQRLFGDLLLPVMLISSKTAMQRLQTVADGPRTYADRRQGVVGPCRWRCSSLLAGSRSVIADDLDTLDPQQLREMPRASRAEVAFKQTSLRLCGASGACRS